MRVKLVTLGCDKNTVDSERYLAQLLDHGAEQVHDAEQAELVIVNTCGFIDAAKAESIDAIVAAGRLKGAGAAQAVVAVGCMVERHKDELVDALPEVDLFLGASEMEQLVPRLRERGLLGDPVVAHPGLRVHAGGTPFVRYLKVSEGCDHGCAFCAIPLMRGKHRSFAPDDVVKEAQLLELQGAREVNLVAQDLAHYGRDLREQSVRLPELLEALLRETSIPWIRNMYLYSAGITPRLLEVIANNPRILPYLDMPIQHASDAVLERMRRPERQRTIRDKVARFREAVPGVAIRTTCIVGFPGETEADFRQLVEFLQEIQFERVGVFTYSPQEGTRGAELHDDVPEGEKLRRLEIVQELQRHITAERYESRIGSVVPALVEAAATADEPARARLPWQADDIDGVTWVATDAAAGSIIEVEVQAVVDDYDFEATFRRVLLAPPSSQPAARSRALPMMGLAASSPTTGSFGR
ncbi:MAG: 30S ribosomal protein S12 methylthiotransferase RimO [Gemmatimonadaceae bacterium]|nr:30S ribosomal protein S12 methylthiotransferase RimO [Gemmatimonadaceae bacterium]MCW5826309.1 30S ribosomal protein S12 methylthiotransferase RimO [Gemmatimonadaceae bacterium]